MISRDALIENLAQYVSGGEYGAEVVVDRLLELVDEDRGILDYGCEHAYGLLITVSELGLNSDNSDWAHSLNERHLSGAIKPYEYPRQPW